MGNYDFVFKLVVVKAYLAGVGGYKAIANKFGIAAKKTVRKVVYFSYTSTVLSIDQEPFLPRLY